MRKRIVAVAAAATAAATTGAAVGAPAAELHGGAGQIASAVAAQAQPTLTVRPRAARRGGSVVLYGRGFAPLVRVQLLAGQPESDPARIGSARTDEDGEFVAPIAIERRVRPGRYLALACRHDCRVKASAAFRVLE